MGFQGHMHANVRGDMIAFDGGSTTCSPVALKIEIVSTFTSYMFLANMVLWKLVSFDTSHVSKDW